MAESNYYEKMSNGLILYPELAICIEEIDRQYPKNTYKFIIPALTPDMGSSLTEVNKEVHQQNTAIVNQNNNIEVENIKMTNYIEIPLPRELLSYLGMYYRYNGNIHEYGYGTTQYGLTGDSVLYGDYSSQEEFSGNINISGNISSNGNARLDAYGSVSEDAGYVNVSGTGSIDGDGKVSGSMDGNSKCIGTIIITNGNGNGNVTYSNNHGHYTKYGYDYREVIDRYIAKNSEWIVMFIGGDINKPRIIAPYNHLPSKPYEIPSFNI